MPLVAVAHGGPNIVEFLTQNGAQLKGDYGSWPLYEAIAYNFPEIVKLLISKKVDVNGKNWDCDTPLYKAVNKNCIELVIYLINSGANVNLSNDICNMIDPNDKQINSGQTPLEQAKRQGFSEIEEIFRK